MSSLGLPGIGQKSAQRTASHSPISCVVSRDDAGQLSQAILDVKDKLTICTTCNNISDSELCQYSPRSAAGGPAGGLRGGRSEQYRRRGSDAAVQWVVSRAGRGALSTLRGIGPEQLKIKSLVDRIAKGSVEEVIAATNPTVEGEATAVYLSKLLKPLGIKVTRIAMGVPVGSDLEFADEVTMWKAMEGRREI